MEYDTCLAWFQLKVTETRRRIFKCSYSSIDGEDAALLALKVDVWPTNILSDKLLFSTLNW